MERNSLNVNSKTISMKKLLLTALIISNSFLISYAGGNLPGDKVKDVAVTSLGVSDGKITFNCKYVNLDGQKFHLELMDAQGNKLYKEIFSDVNFNKTFVTPTELGTIYLVITNLKDKSKRKFEISTEQRFIQDVSITSTN